MGFTRKEEPIAFDIEFKDKKQADDFQYFMKNNVERNNLTERITDTIVKVITEIYIRNTDEEIIKTKELRNSIVSYFYSWSISAQTVESVEWHRLTSWRHAEALYKNNRTLWNKWHKRGWIPFDVEMRVRRSEL